MQRINERLLNWASILDEQTRRQAITASGMPFIYPHIALMPDAHLGKGATVGSVLPTVGAIMPAAVGVDIGCGMMAVRTQYLGSRLTGDPQRLHAAISSAIPLSAGKYNTGVRAEHTRRRIDELAAMPGVAQAEQVSPNWSLQLGSLGSGNHFIEVSLDSHDRVWLFLHSGSRGVGNKLAGKHIRVAQQLCRRRTADLPHPDLAYLEEGEPEFDEYAEALRWAQHFALLNRAEMMDRLVAAFERWQDGPIEATGVVNCHHNYTESEEHFGRRVWVSRKGAISARAGEPGLIPGSMGTASYVVAGRGNPLSLCSAPHGAGRNYSRSAARRRFTRADLDRRMAGIAWGRSDAFLDEHPDAYKDIDQVMADAADLVEIRHTLRQIVNVKGD
ncbi:MAG TPA: RtcB family protein [Jatrophihabitans sp.]|nr:RtcB family protein [Jatrophihabitans sp.]